MSRGGKKGRWKLFFKITVCIAGLTVTVFAGYQYDKCRKYQDRINLLEDTLSLYERVVYVASEKLPRGTVLTEDCLERQVRYSDYPKEEFISEDALGLSVAQDIPEGTCLLKSMLVSQEGDVREVYLEEVEVPEHIQEKDRIDVRIRYENAEDYIVLSDKQVHRRISENGLVLSLTEEEILLISSAIADSGVYDHVKLYAVEYPEYVPMEAGKVTYPANLEVLRLLNRENTEGESRTALEQRLLQKEQ